MLADLKLREREGRRLRVLLVGAGSMGLGIAYQVGRTPGMELAGVVDRLPQAAAQAAKMVPGKPPPTATELFPWLEGNPLRADVLVESTNTVEFAARACVAAIENRMHIVLMNAEVDLLLGPLLHGLAAEHGVGITSDAGDQHGVLKRMIDEIELWGFRIAMGGNIKGFLDRYATAASIAEEARSRALNPIQCVAYTDGTKLNIEMALLANATGLGIWCRGMEGPRARDVREVFGKFDFARYGGGGVVDYVLGAEPGGGVFVVGHCDDRFQRSYLRYYKLGDGPYYLFYRPYHLCHIETPGAIADLCLRGKKVLAPTFGKATEVVAFAKRDLKRGAKITHGIGGDHLYGMIERREVIGREGAVPVALLDAENGAPFRLVRDVRKDELVRRADLEIPDAPLQRLYARQEAMLARGTGAIAARA